MSDKVWRLTSYGVVVILGAICLALGAITWLMYSLLQGVAILPLPELHPIAILPLAFFWSVIMFAFDEDGPTSW